MPRTALHHNTMLWAAIQLRQISTLLFFQSAGVILPPDGVALLRQQQHIGLRRAIDMAVVRYQIPARGLGCNQRYLSGILKNKTASSASLLCAVLCVLLVNRGDWLATSMKKLLADELSIPVSRFETPQQAVRLWLFHWLQDWVCPQPHWKVGSAYLSCISKYLCELVGQYGGMAKACNVLKSLLALDGSAYHSDLAFSRYFKRQLFPPGEGETAAALYQAHSAARWYKPSTTLCDMLQKIG